MSNQRVVIKRPGEPAAIQMIKPGLTPLQELVGGYIERAMTCERFFEDGDFTAYVNEDGIRLKLKPNILRPSDNWPLLGTVVVVKSDELGDDAPMTEAEAQRALHLIASMREAA